MLIIKTATKPEISEGEKLEEVRKKIGDTLYVTYKVVQEELEEIDFPESEEMQDEQ